MVQYFLTHWHVWAISAAVIGGAIILALIAHWIIFWFLRKLAHRKGDLLGRSLVQHACRPTRWIFPLIAVLAVLPGLPLPHQAMAALQRVTGIGLIATIAWLVILASEITSDVLTARYRVDVADNLAARRIHTQFQVLHRVVVVVVVLIAIGVALMTFPAIQHIGESVLASAGLAGLVVGIAMKGTLSNLIAGIQIAFTQPFRIEDAVVVEGEWGWIEEIGTMYVVVRIWDLRRLVLPLSYFLDHPFQNWTRTSAELLGSVFLNVDYTVPIDELRKELHRICESTPMWLGKVCVLQASDSTEHTVQVRALMDAKDSGTAWDLRCYVREKLIDYLQKNYPGSLPRYRADLGAPQDGHLANAPENGPAPLHFNSNAHDSQSQVESAQPPQAELHRRKS